MNKRIKLPAQEWLGYDPEKGDLHGYTFEQMREFAELIVRECIVDYYRRYLDICSDEDITVQVERYVKEYFGVK